MRSSIVRLTSLAGCLLFVAACGDGALSFAAPDLAVPREPAIHRPVASACTTPRPEYIGTNAPGAPDLGGAPAGCNHDADCTKGAAGRCTGDPHDGYFCTYDACTRDDDCNGSQLCDCRSAWRKNTPAGIGPTRCLPSNCRTDADCGVGGYCSPTFDSCGSFSGVSAWACHTAKDTCVDDADCAGFDGGVGFGYSPYCAYQRELGYWACSNQQCAG